jgi:hypothetical protein
MVNRCGNPKDKHYELYGGRGIRVCAEWRENVDLYREWAVKNGWAKELQLDRIDPDGNYCPENCRFVSPTTNMLNRRKTPKMLAHVARMRLKIDREATLRRIRESCSHPVVCVETAITWPSIIAAAKAHKIGRPSLRSALCDAKKTAASYHWRYA